MKKVIIRCISALLLGIIVCLSVAFSTDSKSMKGDCLTMSFAAYENNQCIATFDMYSNCTFVFVNKEESPYLTYRGTYVMDDGPIVRGCDKRITIYVDGQNVGSGTLIWPLQQNLTLILGEFIFSPTK